MAREHLLDNWLTHILKTAQFRRVPLAGDASFRRYYRIYVGEQSMVVMDAPPPESPAVFVDIATVLAQGFLTVPKVIASDFTLGFLLLSDFGDRLYLNELNTKTADLLYQDAFFALLKIQRCQATFPSFDREFLHRQMDIFEEWFLQKHQGINISEEFRLRLAPIYEKIFQAVESQPYVFVHRDYHSRNLMIVEHNGPGILDFQDAMLGPITYDLVSLLQDCYIAWPREQVVAWVRNFQILAEKAGILEPVREELFLRWFDWTGLQRHLKNLGIFSRLHYRDHKSGYLKDLPQVLSYIQKACTYYEELSPLWAFFETLPQPAAIES